MATILAHITVREGAEERFEEIARELHEATHRTEDDVLRYEYWRGAEARRYYTLLSFTDEHAFFTHQVAEHHEEAGRQLGAVIEEIRLEWVDPVDGAATLPRTVALPVPEDANERWLAYHARQAAQEADWWQPLRG
ncbi:MAG: antibiotic biosynthesis monooxygenase [Actinomycetota bacterium]